MTRFIFQIRIFTGTCFRKAFKMNHFISVSPSYTYEEYVALMQQLVSEGRTTGTDQNPETAEYTRLNLQRTLRWNKTFVPDESIAANAKNTIKQTWWVITEPWCGDAAHSVPQIYNMVKDNPHIQLNLQLRDSPPLLIDEYLTNGGKSIPKLVIRNAANEDLAIWGPRPQKANVLFQSMKSEGKSFDEIKEALQRWYNEDKGLEIQNELAALLVTSN